MSDSYKNILIAKIKEHETTIYISIFILGIILKILILEYIGIGLFLFSVLRSYLSHKSLESFLVLLFILSVSTSIILKTIINDIHIKYSVLFYLIIILVSLIIKKLFTVQIRYNKKYWGIKSIGFMIFTFILVAFYYISLANFVPNFSGSNKHTENDKYYLFYENNIDKTDIKILNSTLNGFDYLYERENSTFKLVNEENEFNLKLYYPKKMWNDETTDELFHLYRDSLNNIGLSKRINITLVANSVFGQQEKRIN